MSTEQSPVHLEHVHVEAGENWLLSATRFQSEASKPNAPVVLISSAAAMPQGFYAAFAEHLVKSGAHAVITYDYRGIVGSAGDHTRWPELRMRDWGVLDFPAMAKWCKDQYPARPLVGMGHSYGGQALGLCGCSNLFERYATAATQSGYWRAVDEPYSVWFKTQVVGKTFAKLLGRIPSWAGFGLTLPGTIFNEWAKWVNTPDYFMSDPLLPETRNFKDVTLPFLSIGLTDDKWGTRRAIEEFMANFTEADLRQIWLSPEANKTIGHFRFFRPENSETCWPVATEFLLEGKWPDAAEAKN